MNPIWEKFAPQKQIPQPCSCGAGFGLPQVSAHMLPHFCSKCLQGGYDFVTYEMIKNASDKIWQDSFKAPSGLSGALKDIWSKEIEWQLQPLYPPASTPGAPTGSQITGDLEKAIPGLKGAETKCPVKDCQSYSGPVEIVCLVQHLNDSKHRWSREDIASWLETLDADLSFA
jgi:hypothetical protein